MIFWRLSGSFNAVHTGLSTLGFWVCCTLLIGLTLGCADGSKDLEVGAEAESVPPIYDGSLEDSDSAPDAAIVVQDAGSGHDDAEGMDDPPDTVIDAGHRPGATPIMDPQREAWRAEGQVRIEGNRFIIEGQPYYPKTDFLTAVHPGDDWSSWSSLFYFSFDADKRRIIREALVDQEYNSIYLYTLNQGDGIVTPYGNGGFSSDVNALNRSRLDSWRTMVRDLLDHRLKPFIWLAGDDSPAVAAMSFDEWRIYVDHMVDAFEEFAVLWVIGLEVDEYWSPAAVEERRAYLASRTQHPIGVHLTINETRNTQTPYQAGFDFVLGQLNSPQSNADYVRETQAYALRDVPWIASEFNVFGQGDGPEAVRSVTERSRAIGTAIASVGEPPLVAGIGNGIGLNERPVQAMPDGPPEDFAGVIWLHTNVADWPETAQLSSVTIRGEQICLDYDKANQWPITSVRGSSGDVEIVSNPWIFIRHEGQWYAATWEWMRPGQICKAKTSVAGDHIKQPPFRQLDWRPTPGETYWFMVSAPARNGQMTVAERSNLVPLVWPGARPGGGRPEPGPDDQSPPPADGQIRGYVDRVDANGNHADVYGWACYSGWDESIDVHVYANGPAGAGTPLGVTRADRASEDAVALACSTRGRAHRFRFRITEAQRRAHRGQPIFVHGISPVGGENALVSESGVHRIPAP